MQCAVIFGGTGFVGTHLTQHLLATGDATSVVVVDLLPPREAVYAAAMQAGLATGVVRFVRHDVRLPIPDGLLPRADVIYNLAAVHREPGHKAHEYYDTNVAGATHACAWAERVGCETVVFTSSISPYGPSEERKTEATVPTPETPYGHSKLQAEVIHHEWQQRGAGRRLLIVRPGVVFGPGEGGNVTRLIRSLKKGYFFYAGNRTTIKAGGYVKELCRVMQFGLGLLSQEPVLLLNFTLDPPPTLETMVEAIRGVLGKRLRPVSVPRGVLLGVSHPIAAVAKALRIKQPIDPVRVRKLFRSNHVAAVRLRELGYAYSFSLEEALVDWKRDVPTDF
jgi:nucleoside-diphosphate-sugar epimerase